MSNVMNCVMDIVNKAGLEEKYERVRKMEPGLDKDLAQLYESYWESENSYYKECESTAQQFMLRILRDDNLQEIHSARYRIKTAESLISKYITKKAVLPKMPCDDYEKEKYRPMNGSNYQMVITDLIGIRMLIRYRQQWEIIHKWISDNFRLDKKLFIKNWMSDYPAKNTEPFIAERPKLYFRDPNESAMYKVSGKEAFDKEMSTEGYNSIHYVLFLDGQYAEIQVRTVFDEAWSECTHDLVYKCQNKSRRAELEQLSKCLATETQAAGELAGFMYDKSKAAAAAAKKR